MNLMSSRNLQPHQQRVVNEKSELDEKISLLEVFINDNPIYKKLDDLEQDRLVRQLDVMKQYSNILEERIKAFN